MWLWLASAVVGGVVPMALSEVFIAPGNAFTATFWTGSVMTVIQVVAAVMMPRGAEWARIVLSIIAGVSVVGVIFTLLAPAIQPAATTALVLVCLPLTVAATVLMWLPPSRHFLHRL
jgi:hypothetical protein